jgi:arabinofuranosyltransferase
MAARAALRCGQLHELVEAVDDPLTPGRFVDNVLGAVGRTSLRIPAQPEQADVDFC